MTGIPGKTGIVYSIDRETGETGLAGHQVDGARRAGGLWR